MNATLNAPLSPSEARARAQAGRAVLLDVRTPAEFAAVHAEGAVNVPLDQLSAAAVEKAAGPLAGREVAVLCKSGMRAERACAALEGKLPVSHAKVEGGTDAWVAAGLPVQRGVRRVLPVDRQVRLVAGTLVVVGVAAGLQVAPGWFGLSAFVGVGLIVAGAFDYCPLALLLARMPWNR